MSAIPAIDAFVRALAELPICPTPEQERHVWTLKRVAFIEMAIEAEQRGDHDLAQLCADAAVEAKAKVEALVVIHAGKAKS